QPITQNGQPIYAQLMQSFGSFVSDSLTLQVYRQNNNNPWGGYQQVSNIVAAGQYQVTNPAIFSAPFGQPGMMPPYQQPYAQQTVCVSSQSWAVASFQGPWAHVQSLQLVGTVNVPYYNYNPYQPPTQATYPMPITMVING